jgi:hypothetical protein
MIVRFDTSEAIEVGVGGPVFDKSQTRRAIKIMEKEKQPCLNYF